MSSSANIYFCCQCGCTFPFNLGNAVNGGDVIWCFHCGRSVVLANPNPGVVIFGDQQSSSGDDDDDDPDPAPFDDVDMFPSSIIGLASAGFLNAGVMSLDELEQEFEQWYEEPIDLSASSSGTQPASRAAVEALPDFKISVAAPGDDPIDCSVCMESFDAGEVVKQMPCKHMFHDRCILRWLDCHNSCPFCQYELPR